MCKKYFIWPSLSLKAVKKEGRKMGKQVGEISVNAATDHMFFPQRIRESISGLINLKPCVVLDKLTHVGGLKFLV